MRSVAYNQIKLLSNESLVIFLKLGVAQKHGMKYEDIALARKHDGPSPIYPEIITDDIISSDINIMS